ncbi:response regulator transcription factor [Cohnella sp. 56]|uniref:response regulator transcription factor n=1 Tax=Cohnella sp. 56 TaxID=3113722 RepID=UPI0030E8C1D5
MNNATILIADDEREIADLIALHLEKEGYRTVQAFDGVAAVRAIESKSVDLAILDIMMPGMDGFEVVRHIRERHRLPVLFVSAKTSDFDKIAGLVIGADDYMTKPFNPMELVARVQALLRRSRSLSQTRTDEPVTIVSGGLTIIPEQRHVSIYGETIELTPKEFDILCLLASHPKKVFGVEQIFLQVWGEAYYEVGNNTVMVHIRTLRKKLGEDKNKDKWIKTIWGVGYTFNG